MTAVLKNLIVNIVDLICLTYFCNYFFGKNSTTKRSAAKYISYALIVVTFSFLMEKIDSGIIKLAIKFASVLCLTFFFKAKWYLHILAALQLVVLLVTTDMLAYGLIEKFSKETDAEELFYYAGMYISRVITLFYVGVIFLLTSKRNSVKNSGVIIAFYTETIMSAGVIGILLFGNKLSTDNYLFIPVAVIIINMIVTKLIDKASVVAELNNNLQVLNLNFEILSNKQKQLKAYIHDTNKHFRIINEYIGKNDNPGAVAYINKTLDIVNSIKIYSTGNIVLDAFVNGLHEKCETEGIKLNIDISVDCEKLKIDDYQFSIIVGNILDNAYNAAKKCGDIDKRYISLKTEMSDYKILLIVENGYDKADFNDTTGIGMENIKNAVHTLQGIYEKKIDKNSYKVRIMLPINFGDK